MSATALDAQRWLTSRPHACVVSVIAVRGSTPRIEGTRMLVDASGIEGTIGGGHLEDVAIGLARSALEQSHFAAFERQWALGPSLGQCCGGVMRLRFERLEAASLAGWTEAPPRFRVQIYGAGHVGRAIVQALLPLHCHVRWVEQRRHEFERFAPLSAEGQWRDPLPARAQVEPVLTEDPVGEVALAPDDAVHLVLTHSHALDFELVSAILKAPAKGACGLIGSKTKKVRFERQLQARDIAYDRLVCPIGLPGVQGKEPEVIAVAVAAQLLMGQWPTPARLLSVHARQADCLAESLSPEPVSAGS